MPGTNAGTGHPIHFRCTQCRRRRSQWPAGGKGDVLLTGRVRGKERSYYTNSRMMWASREYECKTCGHVGWSKHKDLYLKGEKSQ